MKPLESSSGVPDGGWGWIVVAAVAFINMTNQSILSVFGLLFGSELNRLGQTTFTAALIINLNSLAYNFAGFLIGPAIKSLDHRNVAAIGCMLASFGMLLCSFATEGWHFIIGFSLFVGLGLGFISPSTFIAINSCFSTKRGRAVGVSLAGTGLGQIFMPHAVRLLLDNYGFRVAVLAMSILSLTGLFGVMFLKPLTSWQKHNNRQHMKLLLETDDEVSKTKNKHELEVIKVTANDCGNNEVQSKGENICAKIFQRIALAMDLELLKDLVFWSIMIGIGLVYTSTINFSMLFPNFLQYSVKLSSIHTATCMSIVAGADIVCRLLLPFITDKLKVPYRLVFLLGTTGLLISRTALAESVELPIIIAMSIFTGMTKSATVINSNLTISSYCRPEKLAGGLGLFMILKGILVITVGQFLGWIRDYSNSYVICIHAQNIFLLFVVLIWTPEIYYSYRKNSKLVNNSSEINENNTKEQLVKKSSSC